MEFCPNCDVQLKNDNGLLSCPKCKYVKEKIDKTTKKSEEIDSSKILNLIEKVDGLRRNNRFTKAVKIYDVFNRSIFPQTDNFIPWINLSKLLLNLNPSSTKIKGKEIAKDLTNQRIKIIKQIINTKDE